VSGVAVDNHSTIILGIIEDIGIIMGVIQELDITRSFFIVEMGTLLLVVAIAVKIMR
jgi:hypothetical protein